MTPAVREAKSASSSSLSGSKDATQQLAELRKMTAQRCRADTVPLEVGEAERGTIDRGRHPAGIVAGNEPAVTGGFGSHGHQRTMPEAPCNPGAPNGTGAARISPKPRCARHTAPFRP